MRLAIGSDHAGFPLKATILDFLRKEGHEVEDFGSFDEKPVDFPDITREVGNSILSGDTQRGIMICGTGVGACIAANKIPGIRASLNHDVYSAHQCVEHDNVNVMAIGAQIVGPVLALELIETFLKAEFNDAEEFVRRVEKISQLEEDFRR
ncbi:ribose 5-phosphate isomerase B [Salibacterium salarium]|uniref:Ribose 5-phosphate isomerase B n=1 Tax=Salibacterium salarium TaxID=284579 RepID=A0A428N5Y1_9BACI|nr:ribose 5-phosphate isomerase B [Salibacterium salarium]RSL33647.1 ribose 5-phosphate isomerase B [Salibacterium salarium]